MRRIVIAGAGGRDFHTFNTLFRDDPFTDVVAFTAAQIPNIDDRTYPPDLAGPRYVSGIPIRPEAELVDLVTAHDIDEVVFAYSDIAYADVMHLASQVLAAGADFRLVGHRTTLLRSTKPVIAVCATRTGCGKSQTSRVVAAALRELGLRAAVVRHPMPYGALSAMRVQRFATLEEIDASHPTIEEREEYEQPVRDGFIVFAGVDYGDILRTAEREVDVVIWDGGNNDLPFYAPDLTIVVADALRPGHELAYHPGEANVRLADVVVVNKVDTADPADVERELSIVGRLAPHARVILADSPAVLEPGPDLAGRRALVVDDGPTLTHGGMPFGAGVVAACRRRRAGRSPSVRRRHVGSGVPAVPAPRCSAPGDGLWRPAARRPRCHHRGDAVRRRHHRHPDRPRRRRAASTRRGGHHAAGPPRALRARRGGASRGARCRRPVAQLTVTTILPVLAFAAMCSCAAAISDSG